MFEEQIKDEFNKISKLINTDLSLNHSILIDIFRDFDFYKNFVKADGEYNNFQLLTSIASDKIYPNNLYTDDDALRSLQNFQNKFSIINNDELYDLITLAIDLRFNYTIRPVTTLLSFIFSDSLTISTKEALLKLKYFKGQDKILNLALDIIDSFENKEDNLIITKAYFKNTLITRIKQLVTNLDTVGVINLTDEIFSFIDEIGAHNLIVLSLIIFFDDIKMFGIVEKLVPLKNNYDTFNQNTLSELLNNLLNDNSDIV